MLSLSMILVPMLLLGRVEPPVVHAPPPDEVIQRFGLTPFYEKCTMVGELPIVSSAHVDDRAHLEAAYLIRTMLAHRPELIDAVGRNNTRFVIMAPTEMTTDVPEHSDLAPKAYWDKRARGLGATDVRPAVSCGEENLLQFQGDPYKTENILIHEFAHAIHEMGLRTVDPTFDNRLRDVYNAAMAEGLWDGVYASSNRMEYWAEGVQSWFDTNRENDNQHNHVNTRAEIKEYDPRLAALLKEVFGDTDWRYVGPRDRIGQDHLVGWDPGASPTFSWPPEVIAAWEENERRTHHLARRNGETVLDHLTRKAEAGDADSQVHLGWRFREGDGVTPDDRASVRWYRKAAEQGHPGGLDSLGWMYQEGRGVRQDDRRALNLYAQAARQKHRQAMWNMGRLIESGRGVTEKDPVEGLAWIELAARGAHGHARAYLAEASQRYDTTVMEAVQIRANELAQSPKSGGGVD